MNQAKSRIGERSREFIEQGRGADDHVRWFGNQFQELTSWPRTSWRRADENVGIENNMHQGRP